MLGTLASKGKFERAAELAKDVHVGLSGSPDWRTERCSCVIHSGRTDLPKKKKDLSELKDERSHPARLKTDPRLSSPTRKTRRRASSATTARCGLYALTGT